MNYSNSDAFAGDYSIYSNRDNTFQHGGGLDWNKGNWSHSFRVGYLKFHNLIGDGTGSLPSALNPFPSIEVLFADNGLFTGPNFLAPQQTYQSNKQFKYDGSKVWGSHILRMGVGVNRILGGGFASFFGFGPLVVTAVDGAAIGLPNTGAGFQCDPSNPPPGGCPSDPGAYPLISINTIGNGQGYFTEHPQFGAPAGGQADTRFEAYVGDSWKLKPNLTLTYGLRYLHDTGRTDNDLAPIPCSATTLISCTGNLLDQFGFQAGLGNRVRNPSENFGPQVGFAWDPKHDAKTVIRGGGGVFFENSIFNNVLFDRPGKLATGLFFGTTSLNCSPGAPAGSEGITLPNGTTQTSVDGADIATQLCFQPLGASVGGTTVGGAVGDLQKDYQAAVAAAGPASNGNFVGNTLEFDSALEGYAAYAPKYRPTRSYQMNIGIQREVVKGGVLSVDFVRNLSEHFPLTYDVNHVGDSRYINVAAANNAIAATLAACGAATIDAAITSCLANGGAPATINNFAANGLDSGVAYLNGLGAPAFGLNPAAGQGAAFAGINPNMGVGDFQFPVGHSEYNGLQTEYKQQVRNPMHGVTGMNLQLAYTLSSFNGNGGNDQNFSAVSGDQRDPAGTYGPTTLDRRHQFKFGTTFDIAHHGPRLSLIGGFLSPRPSNLALEITGGGNQNTVADIYRTDLNGDGTIGDLSNAAGGGPGKPGTFQREVSAKNLGAYINSFNSTYGNGSTLSPAGQALVSNNLFTQAQLVSLGAVISPITPLTGPVPANPWYKDVDSVLSWPIKIRESISIEPSVGFFNVFNFANFAPLTGVFTGAPGSVNGTVTNDGYVSRNAVRSGLGSGVFAPGAPRQAEFGLRIDF